jgi:DDE domain
MRAAPTARHVTEPYANNAIEADHGRLEARLQPMRGLNRLACARTVAAGHAFVQNPRSGHYAMTADVPMCDRIGIAFDELATALCAVSSSSAASVSGVPTSARRNSAVEERLARLPREMKTGQPRA